MKRIIIILLLTSIMPMMSCLDNDPALPENGANQEELSLTVPITALSEQQLVVQAYVKPRPVVAHRGTQTYAPENTAAAYRYARYIGSDYLQIDLAMTEDSVIVGFRSDLDNHTNITSVFPGFKDASANNFTWTELQLLDAGSSFSSSTFDRNSFSSLKILSLEQIINICEGKMPDGTLDNADLGNRPGLYLRFYDPWLNSGMEEVLKKELKRLGWYADNLDELKVIPTTVGKVDVANTKGRIILATLQSASLNKLNEVFEGKIPLAFWLWKSSNYIKEDDAKTYAEFINYGINHGAQFIAPNVSTNDLLKPWQAALIRRSNARIQGYTISTKAVMAQFTYNDLSKSDGNIYQLDFDLTDGFIGNSPQYALYFYGRYYLGDKITPNPPFLNNTAITNVFTTLGY